MYALVTNPLVTLVIGTAGGALCSYLITNHFHKRAGLERPAWADDFRADVIEEFKALGPDADAPDFVKIFEDALNEKVLDAGHA